MQYIEAKQFASVLNIDIFTFNYRCKTNKIPSHDTLIGNVRVWEFDTVETFLDDSRRELDAQYERLGGFK